MPSPLTRRDLIERAARLGAAAGAGALLGAPAAIAQTKPATAPPPASTPPMLKAVSLIGDVDLYGDAHGLRPYLLDGPRPTDAISLWIFWPQLQPTPPEPFTLAGAFRQLSDPAGPAAFPLSVLEEQIARANADGRRVVITVFQSFPEWSHPSTGPFDWTREPGNGGRPYPGQGRRGLGARVHDDPGEDGPWAWFVAWCCARWADTGGEPTPGAGLPGVAVGNPRGAHVDWLAPMNEPNLTWWPQRSEGYPDGTIVSFVAQLMRTAATVAARYRNGTALPQGPALLLPNLADVVDEEDDPERGTPWRTFTTGLLEQLSGWQPETPVGWALHNYTDVKYGPQRDGPGAGRWRTEETIELLRAGGWPDPAVWLTEGGYQFGVRRVDDGRFHVAPRKTADPAAADVFAEQVALLRANWDAMAALPVRMWTQYKVNDADEWFQSSLRGPARQQADGSWRLHDPPYPAYALWPRLGA
ncbi:hypothetical protein [Conexibacter arvalis]|uniref:Twin-arginine translocation signal domain-containing protein n=1 Tax=Conexibacter arvalis TaxID=912552 RepID=A0A840I8E0_9ACTN|nr:hypothetical protein [Conexibacter arvalis]MBB4661147.1 hypothetical protein [Conexibacter arvalis]